MSEQKPCFMCDPSILEQGQRCATGAPICDRHRDQLTGNMRPPTAAELALTARAEAAEQQAARLRAAAMLYLEGYELYFTTSGDDVPQKQMAEARRQMRAILEIEDQYPDRAALAASQPAPAAESRICACCGGTQGVGGGAG